MKPEKPRWSWDGLLITSIVLVAGICSQAQQTAKAALQEPTPAAEGANDLLPIAEDPILAEEPAEAPQEKPTYWIGIQGRRVTSPVLRTHLQLADDLGVVVESVMPDSPAEKAGLRKHDVLLRANGDSVLDMSTLQAIVRKQEAAPIELKLIRIGQEKTVMVVPEESPTRLARPTRRRRSPARQELLQQLMQRFGEGNRLGGLPEDLLALAPGMLLQDGSALKMSDFPGGVAMTITRENGGAAKIRVQQGDQTWEVMGDDPESLEQIPEHLRPYVEKMLQRPAAGLPRGMPALPFGFQGENDPVKQRLDQLEKQLRELQRQLRKAESGRDRPI